MKTTSKIILFLIPVLVSISAGLASEKPLASKDLTQALVEEISGEIAFRYAVQISQYDRVQASEGWHEAALMIEKELRRIGYQDIVLEGWPSNGSTRYYTYKAPIGWRAKKGELWILEPRRERLCSFEEIPLTLVKHSHSANIQAELVDVGTGVGEESYQNKDVTGKIVLATGGTGPVMREAVVKRGALGVITWYSPETRPGYPNMIRYTALWPTWEEREKMGFGFNVSKLQGWNLKKMLEEGKKVVLKAEVDAEYYESQIEVLSAAFPGTDEPDSEVLIIGHLCHPSPSANDNGSGSGGMLEIARALQNMVAKGLVKPPKRTIRFLWVPEFNGTIPYIQAHPERTRKTLAAINCDMIGEDLYKTGGLFTITCTPDSLPSYLNDVVVHFTQFVDSLNLRSINGTDHPFAWRIEPFSGGSDHYIFNDGALRVPSVMFGHGDIFHHTSLDTYDKVDASELRRVCAVALGSAYYLASASDQEAGDIALLVSRNGIGRLSADYHDSIAGMTATLSPEELYETYRQVLNVIEHSEGREENAVLSTLSFVKNERTAEKIKSWTLHFKALATSFEIDALTLYRGFSRRLGIKPRSISLSEAEKEMSRVIPERAAHFVCPLDESYLEEKLGPDILKQIKLRGYAAYEALNFVDGKRSVLDIARAVSAEYGPVLLQDVYDFFVILEKADLLGFKK